MKAQRRFKTCRSVEFTTLDVEQQPHESYLREFDIILSTNCIHATRDLQQSLSNIHAMLKPSGLVLLVEATRNLPWYDLVFGLLDGWWRYEDGRDHAIADEKFWASALQSAGFASISMTGGTTEEANAVRIITAIAESQPEIASPVLNGRNTGDPIMLETLSYASLDGNQDLLADIYYPPFLNAQTRDRCPVGHVMLSRKDIPMKQVAALLQRGVLPISVDYRLCPELNILDGPMNDAALALAWVQSVLSSLKIAALSGCQIDPTRVAAIGWSSGGTLALSLAWQAPSRSLAPPIVVLAFYCPTDFEDPFWSSPNYPLGSKRLISGTDMNPLAGVSDRPITESNGPPSKKAFAGWSCPDDPRSQILLHMNWHGQMVPVLCNGLPARGGTSREPTGQVLNLPQPSQERIASFSPLAQVKNGNWHSATYLVHGSRDDMIPWQQSQRTYDALLRSGIIAGIDIVEGAPHLFDISNDRNEQYTSAVRRAYDFIFVQLRV